MWLETSTNSFLKYYRDIFCEKQQKAVKAFMTFIWENLLILSTPINIHQDLAQPIPGCGGL